jgi:rSAM/selenodomain-associated transferase 1
MAAAAGRPLALAANMKNAIILFFRYPRLGKVKTRLAKMIGAEKALDLYRRSLQKTILLFRAMPNCKVVFCVEPAPAVSLLRKAYGKGVDIFAQKGTDLGERMRLALEAVLKAGAEKAVLIGADIPGLSEKILAAAFQELDQHQVVLGPAADGGYYLIGMKQMLPELFFGMAWSTETVFSKTLAVLQRAGISYSLLPELCDLDSAEDLPYVKDFLEESKTGSGGTPE